MARHADNGAKLGFENDLWRAADALRSNMDAAEYSSSTSSATSPGATKPAASSADSNTERTESVT